MNAQLRLLGLVACSLLYSAPHALASEGAANEIGFYTAVAGQVSVTHSQDVRAFPVKLNDGVRFKDVIQTFDESRTKAFFQDDSMLTVGEKSRVEIDEYIYNPEQNVRRAVVKLLQGQVRALVSKVFKANGSKFEIHTPSAVAAARGTYFTVWVENGQSGIINIGETGRVDFTSGGITVAVDPGYFSTAQAGQSPSVPMPHYLGQGKSGTALGGVEKNPSKHRMTLDRGLSASHSLNTVELLKPSSHAGLDRALTAVEGTLLREAPPVLSPLEALEAMNHQDRLVTAMKAAVTLSTPSVGGTSSSNAGGVTGSTPVGTVTTASVSTGSVSTVSASLGSVTTATVAVAPVAPVLAPVAPVLAPVTAVLAPVTPVITTVITTPPAVINGALNNLPKLP